jgi:hypothetical protein
MADPTDFPGKQGTADPKAAAEPFPANRPAPFDADAPATAGYRPLAGAAVVGFSLAVLYLVVLAVCAAVAWSNGTPLPLAAWTLALPLAALVVAGVGWLQVQRSEGTRAGGGLAVWGAIIALFSGLSYGAYLGASFVAVGQQAQDFGTKFLDLIQQGKYDEAFCQTLEPGSRPQTGPDLHQQLQLRFNTAPDGSFSGQVTTFTQDSIVRSINHLPPGNVATDTTIRPIGVKSWEYTNGGYHVVLMYEVSTPERVFEMRVNVQGVENRQGGPRQWYVLFQQSGPAGKKADLPLAFRVGELGSNSERFLADWVAKLSNGNYREAFLDTQPADRREALRGTYRARQLAAMLAPENPLLRPEPLADSEAARRLYLPGYREFIQGGLVQAGDDFWAPGSVRADIPRKARSAFEKAAALFTSYLKEDRPVMLMYEVKDGRLRCYYPFEGNLFHQYMIQGDFIVETDARALTDESETQPWRVVSMRLLNGKRFAPPQRQR